MATVTDDQVNRWRKYFKTSQIRREIFSELIITNTLMIWPRTPVRDTTLGVSELREPVAAGDTITPSLLMSSVISDIYFY